MYRTKKDVDKHVLDINNKIKNPTERSLKGYSVAKLNYQVFCSSDAESCLPLGLYSGFTVLHAVDLLFIFGYTEPGLWFRSHLLRIRLFFLDADPDPYADLDPALQNCKCDF